MIEGTMENVFKADLNGWLEHESKYPTLVESDYKDKLYETFKQSMVYFGNTEEAKEALHNVIFYALINQKDYETDFDVPRFEKGLDYKEYAYLIHNYSLSVFTNRELWKMGTEVALEFIFKLYNNMSEELSTFHKMFIPLSLNLSNVEQYITWTDAWIKEISRFSNASTLYTLLEVYYECINNAFQAPRTDYTLNRVKRLFDSLYKLINGVPSEHNINIFNALYAIVELAKENEASEAQKIESCYTRFTSHFPTTQINLFEYDIEPDLTSNKPNSAPISLIEYMKSSVKDPQDSDHEHVFKMILEYINHETLPNQHDKNGVIDNNEKSGFDRLEQIIIQNYTESMAIVKRNCIYIVRNRGMFWRSVLKVIIQFMDLWIRDIQEAACEEIFAMLVVKENMLPILYKHILKHVQHYNLGDGSTSLEMIKKISKFFEICLNHIQTNLELMLLRDHAFNYRDENDDIRSPVLGSTLFWNISFEENLVRITNQITSFEEETQIPEDVVRKLLILSTVWPYEVVRQLFVTCIQNKDQYKAIVPILINLGNLCTFRSRTGCQDTLLTLVLKDTISPQNTALVAEYTKNITQFIKLCCQQTDFNHDYPLILMPNSLTNPKLLSIKDVLNQCVLRNIEMFFQQSSDSHVILLQFALYLLSDLCDTSSTQNWAAIMSKHDFPAFLYCSPETYLVCLTNILKLRLLNNVEPVPLRLQDWESALYITEKISVIFDYALESHSGQFPLVSQFFKEKLHEFDWKTQLLWYNVTRRIDKRPLKVPMAFFRITGGLDNLFTGDINDTQISAPLEGWFQLFIACKASTKITDELFEHADKWMYNLLLLWKHPHEDTIVRVSLRHVLHPNTLLSVSIEYPNVLSHFLGRLYDSYTDAHSVIQDYDGYEKKELIPFIKDLSRDGTKKYFIILYIMLLLEDNINQSQDIDDKQDNYYVTNLVKILQNFINWKHISPATTSYNDLKLKTKTTKFSKLIHDYKRSTESLSDDTEPKTVYYPILDTEELKSDRAISVITLYHLCSLLGLKRLGDVQQQALERLLLQITEGLIDMSNQQNFQKMLQQQPKNRIATWKKRKTDTKFVMVMRPPLTSIEAKLLRPIIINSIPNDKRLAEALGLKPCLEEEEEKIDNNMKKRRYLYFIN